MQSLFIFSEPIRNWKTGQATVELHYLCSRRKKLAAVRDCLLGSSGKIEHQPMLRRTDILCLVEAFRSKRSCLIAVERG